MELAIFTQKNYPGLLPGSNIYVAIVQSIFFHGATPEEPLASEPP